MTVLGCNTTWEKWTSPLTNTTDVSEGSLRAKSALSVTSVKEASTREEKI